MLANFITSAEINAAIKGLPKYNTPGLDGLPAEFYTTYMQQLKPLT